MNYKQKKLLSFFFIIFNLQTKNENQLYRELELTPSLSKINPQEIFEKKTSEEKNIETFEELSEEENLLVQKISLQISICADISTINIKPDEELKLTPRQIKRYNMLINIWTDIVKKNRKETFFENFKREFQNGLDNDPVFAYIKDRKVIQFKEIEETNPIEKNQVFAKGYVCSDMEINSNSN